MPHPTGPTNPAARKLALDLKKTKNKAYIEIARHIEKSKRAKSVVNISKLEKLSKKYNTFVVPGKVLGIGQLTKSVNVYAFSFSKEAQIKITKAGGKALPLKNILKDKAEAKIVV
ncbi:MAG: 50S ribosomal protein L18e [Candidatus Aenigmarchaeota archaeon]|nr:50S ribosomal protein L18e [Candidatus Aenigmarchaeota archaeon]